MDTKTQKNGLLNIAKGFPTILSTEFAERFSYYGMKAILVMYIFHSIAEGGLGLSKADAAAIASVYGAMIYMTSILGGWVSDRILGTARTVLIGSLFILAGHITLSLPFGLNALLVSLVLLIIGTGLLKPNVATMVGAVITDDSKRSTGFSLLYLSVNIGSFISPIVVGFLRNKYGFHAGFSAAAIVMLIGIITFAYGYKKYFKKMSNKAPNPIDNSEKKNIIISLAIIALIIVGFAFYLFNYVHNPISLIIKVVTILSLLVTVFYFATIFRSNKATKVEKKKVIAYIPIFLSGVALWSVQEGGGTVLQTFMDNSNHPELNAQTQSVNPFVVVIGTSIMMIVYRKFASKLPSLFTRYGIGLLLVAASYYFLVPASIQKHGFSVWWIFGSLAIAAMGEVLISPVGLDLTNKLAPKNFKAQLMSIWNLADSVAQAINAFFAAYFISHTTNYFIIYASIVAVFAIMLFIGGKRFEKVINE